MTENKQNLIEKIQHQRNIVSAAYTYHNISWMNLQKLARSFKVSINTVAQWLCEAVASGYIEDTKVCEAIKQKHIEEYEELLGSKSDCLRIMYMNAFKQRKVNLGRVDLSALVGASA